MRKITFLQLQKKRTDRVNVHLDEEFAFGLALDIAAELRLGQQLSEDEITALRQEDAYRVALDRGAAFLKSRPRSVNEVRQQLTKKECEPEAIERALQRMADLGYVDDHAFARWWVENRMQHRPRGRLALRSELQQRAVPDDVIAEALQDVDEDAAASRLALQRASRYEGDDRAAFDRWLGAYLRRRGFTYSSVKTALDEAWRSMMEDSG